MRRYEVTQCFTGALNRFGTDQRSAHDSGGANLVTGAELDVDQTRTARYSTAGMSDNAKNR